MILLLLKLVFESQGTIVRAVRPIMGESETIHYAKALTSTCMCRGGGENPLSACAAHNFNGPLG